jgi:hypothetical protein
VVLVDLEVIQEVVETKAAVLLQTVAKLGLELEAQVVLVEQQVHMELLQTQMLQLSPQEVLQE